MRCESMRRLIEVIRLRRMSRKTLFKLRYTGLEASL